MFELPGELDKTRERAEEERTRVDGELAEEKRRREEAYRSVSPSLLKYFLKTTFHKDKRSEIPSQTAGRATRKFHQGSGFRR